MDTAEAQIRGFFIGFIVAQFISGWVSGPLIIVVLLLYVFLGETTRKAGRKIVSWLPAMMIKRFVAPPPPAPDDIPTTAFVPFPSFAPVDEAKGDFWKT